ncbi:hypothetical protein Cgig2_016384 [Carnegiea gigantea]|uniref:Uncharacterized protein n=1 Tax=Carnegiea gigantea TaxID=171969 RepID=A0A9Q1K8A4_9CARY|nr:hypothetical protein Cgig2_016384 [Carnegiea gigantea]
MEMKPSIHFVDYVGHHGDYATHLQRLTTHLATTIKAPIAGLNVRVSGEGEEATYVDVPLVPKLECPKLPFPPTFIGRTLLIEGLMPLIPKGILLLELKLDVPDKGAHVPIAYYKWNYFRFMILQILMLSLPLWENLMCLVFYMVILPLEWCMMILHVILMTVRVILLDGID